MNLSFVIVLAQRNDNNNNSFLNHNRERKQRDVFLQRNTVSSKVKAFHLNVRVDLKKITAGPINGGASYHVTIIYQAKSEENSQGLFKDERSNRHWSHTPDRVIKGFEW